MDPLAALPAHILKDILQRASTPVVFDAARDHMVMDVTVTRLSKSWHSMVDETTIIEMLARTQTGFMRTTDYSPLDVVLMTAVAEERLSYVETLLDWPANHPSKLIPARLFPETLVKVAKTGNIAIFEAIMTRGMDETSSAWTATTWTGWVLVYATSFARVPLVLHILDPKRPWLQHVSPAHLKKALEETSKSPELSEAFWALWDACADDKAVDIDMSELLRNAVLSGDMTLVTRLLDRESTHLVDLHAIVFFAISHSSKNESMVMELLRRCDAYGIPLDTYLGDVVNASMGEAARYILDAIPETTVTPERAIRQQLEDLALRFASMTRNFIAPDELEGFALMLALRMAATHGYQQVVRRLLVCRSEGDTFTAKDTLSTAVRFGHFKLVQELLAWPRAPPTIQGIHMTDFVEAVRSGHDDVALFLLNKAPEMFNPTVPGLVNAAASSGRYNVMRALLSFPHADLMTPTELDFALRISAGKGDINMFQMLWPWVENPPFQALFDSACLANNMTLAEEIVCLKMLQMKRTAHDIDFHVSEVLLMQLCQLGHASVVETFCELATVTSMYTTLHVALAYGKSDVGIALIKRLKSKPDVHVPTLFSFVLVQAARFGMLDLARTVFAHPLVNARDAAMQAIVCNKSNILSLLLRHATCDRVSVESMLKLAVEHGFHECVGVILKSGKGKALQDSLILLAMHQAIHRRHTYVVRELQGFLEKRREARQQARAQA